MSVLRSVTLFVVAAVAEIGGAWLVWQGVREDRSLAWIGAGSALAAYGFVATFQDDPHFGRILAAYGVFVAGSLAWGVVFDGFRPDRYDVTGALICLAGVGVIMYAPRPQQCPRPSGTTIVGTPSWLLVPEQAGCGAGLVRMSGVDQLACMQRWKCSTTAMSTR